MVIKYIEYIKWIYILRDGNKIVLFYGEFTEFLH